jgi:hypothetical protein
MQWLINTLIKTVQQQNLIIALAFSMWLGIKNVIRANRMISLMQYDNLSQKTNCMAL